MAANQSMSPLHVQAYLDVADRALDAALQFGPRPTTETYRIDYAKSRYLWGISVATGLGLGIVKQVDDAFVMFFEFGSTYTFHSVSEGFQVPRPGRYRVTVDAYPYQAETPVNLTIYRGLMAGVAASLDELIGTFDLEGPRTVEITPFLRPGELIGLSAAELDVPQVEAALPPADPSQGYGGMLDYPGEGIAFKSMTIEGPLLDAWPPAGARQASGGCRVRRQRRAPADEEPLRARPRHRRGVRTARVPPAARRRRAGGLRQSRRAGPRRRPAVPRRRFACRLRAILSAPPFLYHGGEPGTLDDYALGYAAVLLPVAEHAGRRALRPGGRGPPVRPAGAGAAGRADAR